MDKGKKYFRAVTVAVLLVVLSGYGKISDRTFRMQMARMIAGEGMLRLVEAQYGQKQQNPWPRRYLTGVKRRTVPGPHSPLMTDRMQHIHLCFWMACGSVESMPHFFLWENIRGNEEIVTQMQRDGHLIGNHTYDHVQLDKLPGDQACQQIIKTNNEIYEITGEYPMYLRPPYGAWPKDLELCVTMLPVFWDVDTLDWKSKNVRSVENIVKRQVKDGSIILMHDSFSTSVEAALEIADMLTEEGYDLVTADQLLVM